MKLLLEMINKSQELIDGEVKNQKSKKDAVVLLKNIRMKKTLIDNLNDDILDTIEEEKMDDEMRKATDLDLNVDTQVEMLESYLGSLELEIVNNNKIIEEDLRLRRSVDESENSYNSERKRNQNSKITEVRN